MLLWFHSLGACPGIQGNLFFRQRKMTAGFIFLTLKPSSFPSFSCFHFVPLKARHNKLHTVLATNIYPNTFNTAAALHLLEFQQSRKRNNCYIVKYKQESLASSCLNALNLISLQGSNWVFQLWSWLRSSGCQCRPPGLLPNSIQTKVQVPVQRCGLCAFSEMNKQGNVGLSTPRCVSPLSQCVWQICFPNKPLARVWQKNLPHHWYHLKEQSNRGNGFYLASAMCFISITVSPGTPECFGLFRQGRLSMAQRWYKGYGFFLPSLLLRLLPRWRNQFYASGN